MRYHEKSKTFFTEKYTTFYAPVAQRRGFHGGTEGHLPPLISDWPPRVPVMVIDYS